jgi:hypothetical protein
VYYSRGLLGSFIASAVMAFVVARSGIAHSAILTIKGVPGCRVIDTNPNYRAVVCPFQHGTQHLLSTLTVAYFDFYTVSGTQYTAQIGTLSRSGSGYTDYTQITATSTGYDDWDVVASNVLTNANEFDELTGTVEGGSVSLDVIGMSEVW